MLLRNSRAVRAGTFNAVEDCFMFVRTTIIFTSERELTVVFRILGVSLADHVRSMAAIPSTLMLPPCVFVCMASHCQLDGERQRPRMNVAGFIITASTVHQIRRVEGLTV